jgi:hypothetical protein
MVQYNLTRRVPRELAMLFGRAQVVKARTVGRPLEALLAERKEETA